MREELDVNASEEAVRANCRVKGRPYHYDEEHTIPDAPRGAKLVEYRGVLIQKANGIACSMVRCLEWASFPYGSKVALDKLSQGTWDLRTLIKAIDSAIDNPPKRMINDQ
jgi:hypothetical protein